MVLLEIKFQIVVPSKKNKNVGKPLISLILKELVKNVKTKD
jgi:hypothetical protein